MIRINSAVMYCIPSTSWVNVKFVLNGPPTSTVCTILILAASTTLPTNFFRIRSLEIKLLLLERVYERKMQLTVEQATLHSTALHSWNFGQNLVATRRKADKLT